MPLLWLNCAIVMGLALATVTAQAADAAPALDQRPSNTTCLAGPLTGGSAPVTAVNAFPPLQFSGATQVRQHPNDASRFYVSERAGLIRTFRLDGGTATGNRAALDIRYRMAATVRPDSEQWGITSFAFRPGFTSAGGELYVAYNRRVPGGPVQSALSRFTSTDGVTFNPSSERVLLTLQQPGKFHHFGQVQFGSDGFLYLGSGDGNVNEDQAPLPNSRFGKILKINVRTTPPQVQLFALGLRNPWRFTIDGNDLWLGDVGLATREEVNRMNLSKPGGDYGWPMYEGTRCMKGPCSPVGVIPPVHDFGHEVGSAVIGGEVYRGTAMPNLKNHYIFGAAYTPIIFGLNPPDYSTRTTLGQVPSGRVTGFLRLRSGEILANDATAEAGNVWRLVPTAGSSAGTDEVAADVASQLTATGCMANSDHRRFATGVIPYDVNMPLWSDAMSKRRGIALPNGATISIRSDGDFTLPPQTVLLKTFLLESRIVETRLFMNHPGTGGGWRGYTYEWNGTGPDADATLLPGRKVVTLHRPSNNATVTWMFPSREQCLECHTTAAGSSLGLELLQLNRNYTYPSGETANQIETWRKIGMFGGAVPPLAQIGALATRTSGSATERARSYLHANCSFCHRPDGETRVNMDFRYTTSIDDMRVCNVSPGGELQPPGAVRLYPGDPSRSLIPIRMKLRDAFSMPPLGTFVADTAMISTMNAWINTPGVCN
ncbi:MAG: PQQ-dependent sugar dehydrogenase [Rhodospirillales bacterium]